MTRCDACHGTIGAAENPHTFSGGIRYHPGCCPACTTESAMVSSGRPEPSAVDLLKRGHRRGTPRAWAMRGAGG